MAEHLVPDFMTIPEAARVSRIGRTAAYEQARLWRETGGKEGLPNVRVGNLHRVPRALFEQHYGITVTHIPPPTPAGRRRDPAASTPVRDLDTARDEPRPGARKGRRTHSQEGLPFAG